MSKLNAVRIVNLNYNRNTMKVNDETLELGGESTLVSLRNGGGKTVMVQMMMAPFVNARYRDMKDRRFESYFTGSTPTYILTEWVMDGSSSFVTIGMGIRKKPSTGEDDGADELELITFIHEYKRGNGYDIRKFPVTEKTAKGFKVKSLAALKDIMNGLKTDRDYIFDFYELNIDSQRRKYFDRLKQYNINNREWESIIKKINMKESGLSDLFQDAKTIAGLAEKWFLPAVEDKLNDKDNKVKNAQEIMEKFIFQYKENESKLKRKQGICHFKAVTRDIIKSAEEFKDKKDDTEDIRNHIANLYHYILCSVKELSDKREELSLRLEKLQGELNEIEYEKLSYEYNKIYESMDILARQIADMEEKNQQLGQEVEEGKLEIGRLQCIRLHNEYTEASRKVQEYENLISLAEQSDEEKKNERSNVGYTLRMMLEDECRSLRENIRDKEEVRQAVQKHRDGLKQRSRQLDSQINQLSKDIATIKERVRWYGELEASFNKEHSQNLTRSLTGEYDQVVLDGYTNSLKKRQVEADSSLRQLQLDREKTLKELLLSGKRRDELGIGVQELKYQLKEKEKEKKETENCLEEIKKILGYMGISNERLYDKEYISEQLGRRIESLRSEASDLARRKDRLEKEKRMYETGDNLQLSGEIKESLRDLGISIVFGFEWVKQQSLSQELKRELVKKNPFLPYSLIMSKENLLRLQSQETKVFTSNPVPIIQQDMLEESLEASVSNEVYSIGGMSFFIHFNDKLLDAEELKKLLEGLSKEIDECQQAIEIKNKEIEKYTGDKRYVEDKCPDRYQLDSCNRDIDRLHKEIETGEREIAELIQKLGSLEDRKKYLENEERNNEKLREKLQREEDSFTRLQEGYRAYLEYNGQLVVKCTEEKELYEEKRSAEAGVDSDQRELDLISNQLSQLRISMGEADSSIKKYMMFTEGQLLNKDKEDLEALYNALSEKIGGDVKRYQEILSDYMETFEKRYKELTEKADMFNLKEEEYKGKYFDEAGLKALEIQVEGKRSQISKGKDQLGQLMRQHGKKEGELSNKLSDINKLGWEAAKDTLYITSVDFNARKKLKMEEIKECQGQQKGNDNQISSFEEIKNKMDEYSGFELKAELQLELSAKQVRDEWLKLRESYQSNLEQEKAMEKELSSCCDRLFKDELLMQDDFFKNTITTLSEIKTDPHNVLYTLKTVEEVHEKTLHQLEIDLQKIEEEKSNIIDMFYDYVMQVHTHIGRIDRDSSIKINDRYLKMLEIIQPSWEDNQDRYRVAVRDMVESITKQCLEELDQGRNIEELISREITTLKLYNTVVGLNELDVKLYKIEASKQVRISWNQVAENSGGEGFLSAFVILSSLLSYMRKEESDVFKPAEEGKVIIMDNPFAQTNAEHLLKPLMDIARKNNTQLICFTGLGGDSIYNRFDNIYVLSLIPSKLKAGMNYIESEHIKGQDISHVAPSRFQINQEKAEQMWLF